MATNKDADKMKMAKQLLARMTPHHLGHNQSLLDATRRSLGKYEEARQTLDRVEAASTAANARIAEGKRLVQRAVAALKAAVGAAEALQALEAELKVDLHQARHQAA